MSRPLLPRGRRTGRPSGRRRPQHRRHLRAGCRCARRPVPAHRALRAARAAGNAEQLARASRRHGGRRPSWPRGLHLPHRDRRLDTQRGGIVARCTRRAVLLPIVAATLPRGARALAAADLAGAARQVRQPVLLLLGTAGPPWARQITRELAAALLAVTVTELPSVGHEGLDRAPDLLVMQVLRFLGDEALPS